MRYWAALWTFLRRGWCQHPDLVRLHLDGVWVFACPCGYHTPILKRSPGGCAPAQGHVMPEAAPHFCAVPGCPTLTQASRCPAHQVTGEHQRRNWDQRTWYRSKRWKAFRAQILRAQAYQCARCQDVGMLMDVDHIVPHRGSPDLFWDRANVHALCKRCHSRKTQQGQ